MNIGFIKKLSENHPSLARMLEAALLGSLLSVLDVVNQSLQNGIHNIDIKQLLTIFVTGLMLSISMGLSKNIRNRQKELQK